MQWAQHLLHCWNRLFENASAVVPEFQKHSGNNALITVILFLKTRRRNKGPNEASKESGGSQPCF
jgi:hypothetical protein